MDGGMGGPAMAPADARWGRRHHGPEPVSDPRPVRHQRPVRPPVADRQPAVRGRVGAGVVDRSVSRRGAGGRGFGRRRGAVRDRAAGTLRREPRGFPRLRSVGGAASVQSHVPRPERAAPGQALRIRRVGRLLSDAAVPERREPRPPLRRRRPLDRAARVRPVLARFSRGPVPSVHRRHDEPHERVGGRRDGGAGRVRDGRGAVRAHGGPAADGWLHALRDRHAHPDPHAGGSHGPVDARRVRPADAERGVLFLRRGPRTHVDHCRRPNAGAPRRLGSDGRNAAPPGGAHPLGSRPADANRDGPLHLRAAAAVVGSATGIGMAARSGE